MTQVTLPYGAGTISAEVPERTIVVRGGGGERPRLAPVADQAAAVREALAKPLGLPPIRDLVRPGAHVLIAFDDPTVPSYGPVRRLAIEALLSELDAAGVPETNVRLVCANALHRKFTNEELASIIGEDLVHRFGDRLSCHDAEDWDNLVRVGTTEHGYEVDIHKGVVDSDLTIYVNAVCHMGFGGGWKSIAVGLSTWRSISATHTPDGMSMSVRNNRMHAVFNEQGELMEKALGKRCYKIETVLADATKIGRVWAGGVRETRAAAQEVLEELNPPRRSQAREPADVVLYGIPAWSPYAVFAKMNPILTLISSGMGYMGGYIEALAYVRSQREATIKVIANETSSEVMQNLYPDQSVWTSVGFNNIQIEWDKDYVEDLAKCWKKFRDIDRRFSKSHPVKIPKPDPDPRFDDLRINVLLQRLVEKNPALANAVIDEVANLAQISRLDVLKRL
jgi:hypothetical protein